jgi:prephenate dehydrogenase
MQKWDTVAIVGVGLIGGSIGLALREAGLAKRIVGIGRRASSLRKARQRGCVTTTTTRLARGVADAEIVVICSPVARIWDHLAEAADACPAGALITDAGSIKGQILDDLDRCFPKGLPRKVTFVGAHPLAGGENTGPQYAQADLFQGRACILTPTESVSSERLRVAKSFWTSLGARVVVMSAKEHDVAVAAISHVPHIAASALAAMTTSDQLNVVGTGWLDATRIAAGDVELWRQILSGNRSAVLNALDKFAKLLASFRKSLESGGDRRLQELLEAGRDNRLAGEGTRLPREKA